MHCSGHGIRGSGACQWMPVSSDTASRTTCSYEFPRVPKGTKLKQTKFDRTQSDVDELLKEHTSTIEALRVKLVDEPHYDAAVHDELFVLRFVLSNGAAKAEVPLRETIKWRHENAARLAEAATGVRDPKHDAMGKLSIADLLPVTTLQDEPILVVRTGRSNVKALMDAYTEDEVRLLNARSMHARARTHLRPLTPPPPRRSSSTSTTQKKRLTRAAMRRRGARGGWSR